MAKSIDAYESKKRVQEYDADMHMMHPNRPKMSTIALNFLPFNQDQKLNALDLGIGTGFATQKFLEKFPHAHVIGLDGAASMMELAQSRLHDVLSSVEFVVGDFKDLEKLFTKTSSFDVIFTAFALHHLTIQEKEEILKVVHSLLKPGGWFINEDCLIGETPEVEHLFQKLRIEGILSRISNTETRFHDFKTLRTWLDAMEAKEQDNPIKISEELEIMHKAGFKNIDILWKEYREMVLCGQR